MKKLFLFVAVMLLSVSVALAIDTPADAAVVESNEGTYTESPASPDSVVAEGGNVSDLNIESNMSTVRWQGFVGNVSGSLNLGRGSDVLYSFGDAAIDTVFATTQSTGYAWGSLEAGAATDVDTVWGFSDGSDQAVDAFTGSSVLEGISAIPTVNLVGNFLTGIFDIGSSAAKTDFAFGANVSSAKAGFDGGSYEYELMVPTTSAGTDTYYFYLSLLE